MTREDFIRLAEDCQRLDSAALEAVNECAAELSIAMRKHGPMASAHEGYAVILEELDELWDEIKIQKRNPAAMRAEAVQVAAMAMRFLVDVCKTEPAQ